MVTDGGHGRRNALRCGDSRPRFACRSGLEVLQHWRQRSNRVPVIVLTARDAWHERVDGFKAGADDYLGKPFHFEELLVRVQALIRRNLQAAVPDKSCIAAACN